MNAYLCKFKNLWNIDLLPESVVLASTAGQAERKGQRHFATAVGCKTRFIRLISVQNQGRVIK